MTFMEIKSKLNQMLKIESNIQSRLLELESIKSQYIKALDYTAVHVAASRSHSEIERIIEIMDLKEERIIRLIAEKQELEEWFEEITGKLNDSDQAIMRNRYINGMRLETIADVMHYADRQAVYRKIKKIIEKIAKWTTNDYK